MKLPDEVINVAINGSTEERWNLFKCLEVDEEIEKSELDKVKNGVKIMFDIRMLFSETSLIIVKDKENKVIISGKKYIRFPDYRDEIDERDKIMTECIIRNRASKSPLVARE